MTNALPLATTGVAGLDIILNGGLSAHHAYLVYGEPGTGKTTLAMQFMLAGVARQEKCLFLRMMLPSEEIEMMSTEHGWSLDGICMHTLGVQTVDQQIQNQQSVFYHTEVEMHETIIQTCALIKDMQPQRIVFDPISQLRYLSESSTQYQRQMITLIATMAEVGATVLFTSDIGDNSNKCLGIRNLFNGLINLRHQSTSYGGERRLLQVDKMRARAYAGGWHDFKIRKGGLQVFPRLIAPDSVNSAPPPPSAASPAQFSSDIAELDQLVGGPLIGGTSTLIMGPAGSGKTLIMTLYLYHAVQHGHKVAVYLFDESTSAFLRRAKGLNLDFTTALADGRLQLHFFKAGELTIGEFFVCVRQTVDVQQAQVLMIDSLRGLEINFPDCKIFPAIFQQLQDYLSQCQVLTLFSLPSHRFLNAHISELHITYLADVVIVLMYCETKGETHRVITVPKKRYGDHGKAILELIIKADGITVKPQKQLFSGVLRGTPWYEKAQTMFTADTDDDESHHGA